MCTRCPWRKNSSNKYILNNDKGIITPPNTTSRPSRNKNSMINLRTLDPEIRVVEPISTVISVTPDEAPEIRDVEEPVSTVIPVILDEVPEIRDVEEPVPTVIPVISDEGPAIIAPTVTVESTTTIPLSDEENNVETAMPISVGRRGGVRGENVDLDAKIEKHPKTKDDEQSIMTAISTNNFLKNILQPDQLQSVIDAMHSEDVEANQIIIKQGDEGDYMFVSATGRYEILVNNKIFDTFNDNRVFGELAVLYNNQRLATIKSVTKGRVWKLNRTVYQQITIKKAIAEQDEMLSFLKKVPGINKASNDKLQQLANLLKPQFFTTDTVIIRQGDRGDKFYIIKAGTTTITKDGEGKVATFGRGQFFGERALLAEDCRQATVTADSPGVECLLLSRNEFIEYFDDMDTFTKDSQDEIKPPERLPISEYGHIDLNDLKVIRTIGVGGFGRVALVQHNKNEKEVFAVKYLKKSVIIQRQQKEHAFNEKNIQISCNSIFIVRLYNTYQDTQYLYYLMESCMGGDLFGLLQKQRGRCFDEASAKFLAACILEAITYLHERQYIYRDLKPENMLIDIHGYVKLTDFGFAKRMAPGHKTFTFAGTPEYVPPEIINNRGHDKSVDYWTFGIFIFELLVGLTPFRTNDKSHMRTYSLIIKGIENVVFPTRIPRQAQKIIRRLCKTAPSDRLGCQRNGTQDIKNHKWFLGYDWERLKNRQIKSSFVPDLDSLIDSKNFEIFETDTSKPPELEMWDGF